MITLVKHYIELEPNDKGYTHIRFSLSFNKEAIHWATSKEKQKGYQVTATPVTREGFFEKSGAFTGFYQIILPIARQSKNRLAKAEKLLENKIYEEYKELFKERGLIYKLPDNACPECEIPMIEESVGTGEGVNTTYTCDNCGYSETYP